MNDEKSINKRVVELSQTHPSIEQFKNSLVFIQGGTGMTLDRMIVSLRRLCKEMIEEGIKLAQQEAGAKEKKVTSEEAKK